MKLKAYLLKLGAPGLVSATSLLAAWVAILLLLNGFEKYSVIFAALAFLFDSLDGYVARKLNQASELGRQLDSMVDLLAYSIYAALLTYTTLLPGVMGAIVGYMIVLFGILRLLRFNMDGYIEGESKRYYRGIVTCHLSLATIGFLLLSHFVQVPQLVIAGVLGLLSILQLSNIKTLKTRVLPFWYTVVGLLVVGAVVWLP